MAPPLHSCTILRGVSANRVLLPEYKLWMRLSTRQLQGVKFRTPVSDGVLIADFCCLEARLVIELGGGRHI
jgi:very-short-patch-repair endonuclease